MEAKSFWTRWNEFGDEVLAVDSKFDEDDEL
jgi:hypothetical protein